MKEHILEYLESTADELPEEEREAAVRWRVSCYHQGTEMLRIFREELRGNLPTSLLDIGGGWGGHSLAFAEQGVKVVLGDLNPRSFPALQKFADSKGLPLTTGIVDCQALPFEEASFDGILALELIEHIESVPKFAAELRRVMKNGGICIVTTPNRLKAFFWGEPHYGIRFLTLLPFSLQGLVARTIFGKRYPFPIVRQYLRFSAIQRDFAVSGLRCEPRVSGRMGKLANVKVIGAFVREFMWSAALVKWG
jgi:2-polyprenyl-3-methyl-5-hydroxy-6-metoxy-1,4-benzoquinol methylase